MSAILRNCIRNVNSLLKFPQNLREISTTLTLNLKEIKETQNGKELIIEGVYVESPRTKNLVKLQDGHKCALCSLGLDVKHTDVLILSQFVRADGCMLPKRVTGLCNKQQRRVSTLVTMAHKAGLMPNLKPANCKRDPSTRPGYKKYNKYYDESTIKMRSRFL